MRRILPGLFVTLVITAMLCAQGATKNAAGEQDLLSWRAQRAKNLQAPQGWLSLTGLDWLEPGDNPFGSASDNTIVLKGKVPAHLGNLRLNSGSVELLPSAGGFPPGLLVDGRVPQSGQKLTTDASGTPSKITIGTLSMTVIRRSDRTGLRTRDSQSPTLTNFHGLHWFQPNSAYRVAARWTPYQPAKRIKFATVVGTEDEFEVPGFAEFTINGQTFRLEPALEDPADKQLFFVFKDATSKTETYPAARFLYTPMPDHGLTQPGTVVLDFNRAQNPPCAYTAYATCPLPPKSNVLPVAIPAGEKRYH